MFYKEQHAETEIYNDYNSELVNLFKCVKFHCEELKREMIWMLNSRQWFEECKSQYNCIGMTDIQKAARFFMLIKTSYASKGRNYGCVKKDIGVMIEYLTDIQKRLSKVIIENKDFADLIKMNDRPNALFYLDPPYYGTEKYYQPQFTGEDHIRLREQIGNIDGRFILSYNDCEYIRDLYKDFNIESIERCNNLTSKYSNKSRKYNEILIKNY